MAHGVPLAVFAAKARLIAQRGLKIVGRAVRSRDGKTVIVNSEAAIEVEGTIMTVLPGTMFRVALANERLVLAHISGRMRKRFIRLTIGDRVKMEMSPYDTAKARIVYRL